MNEYVQFALAAGFAATLFGAKVYMAGRSPGNRLLSRRVREVEVGGRAALTPNHAVAVLHWRGRDFLVATSPSGLSVLAEEPSVTERAAGSSL